jgi:glycosyltransferase involved in cell wall biosynthesis/SAM-dependent methyltransferase
VDYSKLYNEEYFKTKCAGGDYNNREKWYPFYLDIAKKIHHTIKPKTVLDVGCATGYLVEALHHFGVEAYGVDISEYAISHVAEEIKPYCKVASITDGIPKDFPQEYDLIVSIECIEHLTEPDGLRVVEILSNATEEIVLSAGSEDFTDDTHINVRPPSYWAAAFSEYGFSDHKTARLDYLPRWAIHIKKQGYKADKTLITKLFDDLYEMKKIHTEAKRIADEKKSIAEAFRVLTATKKMVLDSNENVVLENRKLFYDLRMQIEKYDADVLSLRSETLTATEELQRVSGQLNHFRNESAAQEHEANRFRNESAAYAGELHGIKTSKGYRVLQAARKVKRVLSAPFRLVGKLFRVSGRFVRLLSPSSVRRGVFYARRYGIKQLTGNFYRKLKSPQPTANLTKNNPLLYAYQKETRFAYSPTISILVPTYNTDEPCLRAFIESVLNQTYDNWELCIADGNSKNAAQIKQIIQRYAKTHSAPNRIKYKMLDKNLGIAGNTNEALSLATGEYIGLLDHDDEITPNALFEVVKALQDKHFDFIYSDKDMMNAEGTIRFNPLYKPQYSPEIMYSANYLTHFCVIKRTMVDQVGGFDPNTDGAQDWDMFLKICEQAKAIHHIPLILYHWRIVPTSVASGASVKPYVFERQLTTIKNHLNRIGKKFDDVCFTDERFSQLRIEWRIPENLYISVIVINNTENTPAIIQTVKTRFAHVTHEIIEADSFNDGAKNAAGNVLLFIDSSHSPQKDEYLIDLPLWALQDKIGVTFPQLLYNNHTINSTGLIVNTQETYDFEHGKPMGYNGPMGGTEWTRNFSACREHCFAVRKDLFLQAGGLNPDTGGLAMLDFCLSLNKNGYRHMYISYVKFTSDRVFRPFNSETDGYTGLVEKHGVKDIDPYSNPVYEALRREEIKNIPPPEEILPAPLQKEESPEQQPPPPPRAGLWDRYSEDAVALAHMFDFSRTDTEENHKIVSNRALLSKPVKSFCWFIPFFDYASYAGIKTIFRLADYIHSYKGVENHFAILGTPDIEATRKEIESIFPNLGGCALYSISNPSDLDAIPHCDAAIATLWTTAFLLLKFNRTYKKFYFIQDYEPYFYPAGATFAQAAETYRFGFRGITNTQGLKKVYEENFGGSAVSLMPCVDLHVFYNAPERPQDGPRRVFFYGRPGHPRNGFELGTAAFRALKQRMGDRVEIVSAGADWNPAAYGLEGIVNNLGRLPYDETGNLYRTCHAGLIMMFTKHPSYLPFELMACGCPVVSNYNEATAWFLKDGVNCLLTEATATRIAETLEQVITDTALSTRIAENALKEILASHADWNEELDKVWDFINDGVSL